AARARAAQRQRRMSRVFFVLAALTFAALLFAVQALVQARRSEARANEEKRLADSAKLKAEGLAQELKQNLAVVQAAREEAEQRKTQAENAEDAAKDAQTKAEDEKKRADEQALIASRNEENARLAEHTAEEARKAAERNANRLAASMDRSGYHLLGVAAFQREDYKSAKDQFLTALKRLEDEKRLLNEAPATAKSGG